MAFIIANKTTEYESSFATINSFMDFIIENDSVTRDYIIVPTGKMVRKLGQTLIKQYFSKKMLPMRKPKIFTLQSFAQHCFEAASLNRTSRIISEAYRLAIFEEAATEAKLNFFKKNSQTLSSGVLKRLSSIINGLKEDGIRPENLLNDLENNNLENDTYFDKNRLTDIYHLYQKYEELLGNNYVDTPGVIKKVIEYFSPTLENIAKEHSSISEIFESDCVFYFYGFTGFKLPEIQFISLFSEVQNKFAIHIDYSYKNGPLYAGMEDSMEKLLDFGFHIINLEEKDKFNRFVPENADSRSMFFRKMLFSNTMKANISHAFSEHFTIIEAKNRLDEVQTIAKLIKELHFNQAYKLSDICIALRSAGNYSSLFREIFMQYDIPVNISDRYDLQKSPLVISIFSVLDIVNDGFKTEDIQRALKSSFIKFEIENEQIDVNNLYSIANKLRIQGGSIRGGSEKWLSRLNYRLETENVRMKELSLDNSDQLELNEVTKLVDAITRAIKDFNILTNCLDFKNIEYSAEQFSDIIKIKIIQNLKVKERIFEHYKKLKQFSKSDAQNQAVDVIDKYRLFEIIEKEARAYNAFIKLLDEMVEILLERYPNKKFKLKDLTDKLKTAVMGTKYQVKEKPNYGVTVTSIEQTRGISYKVLILCGATDVEFPLLYIPETFLGKELPDSEQRHLQNEKLQFYQFLTNDSQMLDNGGQQFYITYPLFNEREECLRSAFVDALLKVSSLEADGKILNTNELGNLPNHWYNTIASKSEYYKFVAKDSSNQVDTNDKVVVQILNRIHNNQDIYTEKLSYDKLSDEFREQLARITSKPISITGLEVYKSCPYKYFVDRVLKVKQEEDLSLSLTPLEKGNILHKILYKFYSTIKTEQLKNNNSWLETNSEDFADNLQLIPVILEKSKKEEYLLLLKQIALDLFNNLKFTNPFLDFDKERIVGTQGGFSILENWLNAELAKLESKWEIESKWEYYPMLFELGFGGKSDKQKTGFPEIKISDELVIHGKIDRIEAKIVDEQIQFIIADYKTSFGSIANNNEIRRGVKFQVPLYILAAKYIFQKYYKLEPIAEGGVYYSLNVNTDAKGQYELCKFVLIPSSSPLATFNTVRSKKESLAMMEDINEVLEQSKESAIQIVKDISKGVFPVEPLSPESCKYCSFDAICRIKENDIACENDDDDSDE